MNYNDFIAEVRQHKAFDNIKFEEPQKNENLISICGDVIGSGADKKLKEISRKHGFITLANELSIWNTEEDFKMFSGIEPKTK